MALPTAKGEVVTEGLLYRFVPNMEIYWEYDRDRPSPRAFRERPQEDGISMYLDGFTTLERLMELQPTYGICSIPVDRLLQLQNVSVVYNPDSAYSEGQAHVLVHGINRRRAEVLAREIAECLRRPAPPSAS